MTSAPTNEGQGFLDHLEELRRRILACLAVFLAAAAASFFLLDPVVGFLLRPLESYGGALVAVRPAEKFLAYVKAACAAGFVLSLPFAAWQLGRFVGPALYPAERRAVAPFVMAVPALSTAGLSFGWFLLVPFAVRFFAGFAADDGVRNLWSIGEYLDLVLGILLASLAVFQTPLILLALMRLGLASPRTLAKYRRHAIVVILVVAAIVTPPDILTQSIVGVTLWLLFELTLLSGRILWRHGNGQT